MVREQDLYSGGLGFKPSTLLQWIFLDCPDCNSLAALSIWPTGLPLGVFDRWLTIFKFVHIGPEMPSWGMVN